MADEQIRIDITAEDDASKVLEDVATEAETLEKLEPEVVVTADVDQAQRGIEDVSDDAKALSRQDTEILLRAKIDDAKGALKALRDDLDQTGEKAQQTNRELDKVGGGGGGVQTRGNAIADLTGPLGDASSAASDFAGVFEGIGDIAGDVAGKVGINAEKMAGAIGGIGLAVTVAAAAWTYYQGEQQKARERQKALLDGQREINEALEEADLETAARKFQELYKGPLAWADDLGVKTRDMTEYITGQTDALQGNLDAWKEQGGNAAVVAGMVEDARRQYEETNGTLADQDEALENIISAFTRAAGATNTQVTAQQRLEAQTNRNRDALDRMRGALSMEQALASFESAWWAAMSGAEGEAVATAEEIRNVKSAIFDVAEYARLTPIQVKSLLDKVDRGDMVGVAADVQHYYDVNKVPIAAALQDPTSFNAAEYRRRLTAMIGEVPVKGVFTTLRSGNVERPV